MKLKRCRCLRQRPAASRGGVNAATAQALDWQSLSFNAALRHGLLAAHCETEGEEVCRSNPSSISLPAPVLALAAGSSVQWRPRSHQCLPVARSAPSEERRNTAPSTAATAGGSSAVPRRPSCVSGSSFGSDLAEEDQEVFRTALLELEFHEEWEVMTNPAMQPSLRRPSSAGPDEQRAAPATAAPLLSRAQLADMLQRMRLRELPGGQAALQLCDQAGRHLQHHCSSLVRLAAPRGRLVVVGDLHGHLNDLLHLLDAYGEPSETNQYLFNGDFVDRGDWGPEVIFYLFCLMLLHPEAVHLNRGNHEDSICNAMYGFKAQLMSAFPSDHIELFSRVQEAFDQLPLCHVIGDLICVIHAGLPLEPTSLADIAAIPRGPVVRPAECQSDRIREGLLWSDPVSTSCSRPSIRGAGWQFHDAITHRFIADNGLQTIIRSHECVPNGFKYDHGGRIVTVFSASNYNKVREGNRACAAVIDSTLHISLQDAWNVPYVTASWVTEPASARGDQAAAVHSRMCAVGEWDAQSVVDKQAIATLRAQLGASASSGQHCSSPRERALSELRRMIFVARPRLLEAFEAADEKKVGTVSVELWVEVMATCFHTSSKFPWLALGQHRGSMDKDGQVVYADFLARYDNPLSRLLADRWCSAMLVVLGQNLGEDASRAFNQLDSNGDGFLSYAELRAMVCERLPVTGPEAVMHSMHAFALFGAMDSHRTGFVTREEFLAALEAARGEHLCCPQGHLLAATSMTFWKCARACDECGRVIPRREVLHGCRLCDYDLCERCLAARIGLEVSEMWRSSVGGGLQGTRLEAEWDKINAAVCLLCRSHCDPRALLRGAVGADDIVDRASFVANVGELLFGDTATAMLLWDLSCTLLGWVKDTPRSQNTCLRITDFARCLSIVDMGSGDMEAVPSDH